MRSSAGRIAHALCACLMFLVAVAPVAGTAQGADLPSHPIEAVWKPQQLTFQFRSEGRTYACDILEHKIATILRRLGAREQLEVRRVSCRNFAGTAHFELIMESPVAATPENVRDITTYDSQDDLIARVRGVELPSPADLERFPAVWKHVSFLRAARLNLEGDCALVQQLRRQILPKMSIQVLVDIEAVDCSHSRPRLTVQALVTAAM